MGFLYPDAPTTFQKMNPKSFSWINSISAELEYKGPRSFSRVTLRNQKDIFWHRAALFYTPTANVPSDHVGSGVLDVTLPLVTPDYTDVFEISAYRNPRLWVDLLQRYTGKLRWKPIFPACVTFIRYDSVRIRDDHIRIGMKALADALKVKTAGRRDGRSLHYFGAIVDDAQKFAEFSYSQRIVGHPHKAKIRIRVGPKKG
jgi:hypothetical protein